MTCPLKFDIPEEFVLDHPGGIANIRGIDNHVAPLCLFYAAHLHKPLNLPLTKLSQFSTIEKQDLEPPPLALAINYAFLEGIKDAKKQRHYYWIFNAGIWFIDVFLISLATFAYIFWPSFWWSSTIAFGVCLIHFAFCNFHIRNHTGRLTPFGGSEGPHLYPIWFERILNGYFVLLDYMFMVEPVAWRAQHNMSHHILTNTDDDYDIWSPYPLLRLVSWQTRQSWHSMQFIYVILVLSLNAMFFPILNFTKRPCVMTGTSSVLYYSMLIVMPYVFQEAPLSQIMARYFFTIMLVSLVISLIFQVSHNSDELTPQPKAPTLDGEVIITGPRDDQLQQSKGPWVPTYNASNIKQKSNSATIKLKPGSGQIAKQIEEWILMQFNNSMDWGSMGDCLFFGAINFQLVHHLAFATHPVECYFVHRRLIAAQKAGSLPLPPSYVSHKKLRKVPMPKYVYVPSLFGAVHAYLSYLATLAK